MHARFLWCLQFCIKIISIETELILGKPDVNSSTVSQSLYFLPTVWMNIKQIIYFPKILKPRNILFLRGDISSHVVSAKPFNHLNYFCTNMHIAAFFTNRWVLAFLQSLQNFVLSYNFYSQNSSKQMNILCQSF